MNVRAAGGYFFFSSFKREPGFGVPGSPDLTLLAGFFNPL
jgi:hypothetical protein